MTQLNNQTVLFITIQFNMSAKLNGSKYSYILQTIQLNISHLFALSQIINSSISNNSIKRKSLVYTQFKCQQFYLTQSGATIPGQSGPGSDGYEGGALHFTKLQHYWSLRIRLFNVILRTLIRGILPLCRDRINVFYSSSQLGFLSLV